LAASNPEVVKVRQA